MTIRVLLVDDSWEVREKLRILLVGDPDIQLVGEAENGEDAIKILDRSVAEVVVMDLNLPVVSGIDTAEQMLTARPDMRVIIVSLQSDAHYVRKSFRVGVKGYLLKDCAFEELVEAVHIVAAGGSYISPEIEIGVP